MPVQSEVDAPRKPELQSEPWPHQAATTPTRRPFAVVFPFLLILGGALILLVNLGALPEDTGWRLLQLWPLLLVMLGLQIIVPELVRGAAVTVVTLVLVGTIALGGFVYALAGPSTTTASYAHFQSTAQLTAETTAATIRIDDAADRITITARDIGTQLYQAKIDYDGSAPSFSHGGGEIRITRSSNFISSWGRARDVIDLTVNPSVAWTIVIDGAGTTATIDLSLAHLRSFTLNGTGSNVTITAGPPQGAVHMSADGVGVQLTLRLPASVEYRVTADGIGTGIDGVAQTPGWPTAQDRYDVTVNGVGTHATVTTTG